VTDRPSAPSIADVEAIGAWPQPVLRNLRITWTYHELSAAVAERIGPGANWCSFATWASKQAGQSIRGDDLGRKIEETFAASEAVWHAVERVRDLRRTLGRAADASAVLGAVRAVSAPLLIVTRVAEAAARGNKKVFDEIAREFARLLAASGSAGLDDAGLDAFCAGLRPGDPPEGQRLLAAAFRDYERARRLADPKARAERMLLANLRIGFHEQTRLQPEIAEALNAPLPDPADVARRLAGGPFPSLARLPGRLAGPPGGGPAEIAHDLVEHLRAIVRAAVTDELMSLALPDGTVHLGRDLTGTFPPHLGVLADLELVEFLSAVDPASDTLRGSGAEDWASLPQRMRFIAGLFRLQHEDAALFRPPFSPEQLRSMAAGRVPDGAL